MHVLLGEGQGLRYRGQVCCDVPVRAVVARRAGVDYLISLLKSTKNFRYIVCMHLWRV